MPTKSLPSKKLKSNNNQSDSNKSVRVAFYIRVSTAEQHLEGYSPDFQLEQLKEHVERKSYKGWYTKSLWHFFDVGSGGEKLHRKELEKLMALVKKGEVDLVLVWKIDRLSRKLSDLLELFEEMDKQGVGFASVKEDLDFTGAIGKLIFQIFGALAEFERENIRMRTEEGKKASAKAGNYVGGAIPYGYTPLKNPSGKGRKLKRVPAEAKIVKQIFEWYAYQDKSFTWIAKELNKLKTPKGKGNPNIAGTKWNGDTIRRMLLNDVYRGSYITNRWKLVSHKPELYEERPEEEWIHSEVEPCVETTLFYMAREKVALGSKHTGGGGKNMYMLRGKIIEASTGRKFVGYKSSKGTKNYRRKKYTDDNGVTHPNVSIAASGVEEIVWNYIEAAINRPEEFLKMHRQKSAEGKEQERLQAELALYEDALSKANSRLVRADDAFFDETIEEDKYKERKARYEQERDKALENKQKVERRLMELAKYDVACEHLKDFSKKFQAGIKGLTYKQKQRLADMLVQRAEVHETETKRTVKVLFRFDPTAIAGAIPEGRTDVVQHKAEKPLKELPHHSEWWVGWGSNPRPKG